MADLRVSQNLVGSSGKVKAAEIKREKPGRIYLETTVIKNVHITSFIFFKLIKCLASFSMCNVFLPAPCLLITAKGERPLTKAIGADAILKVGNHISACHKIHHTQNTFHVKYCVR